MTTRRIEITDRAASYMQTLYQCWWRGQVIRRMWGNTIDAHGWDNQIKPKDAEILEMVRAGVFGPYREINVRMCPLHPNSPLECAKNQCTDPHPIPPSQIKGYCDCRSNP